MTASPSTLFLLRGQPCGSARLRAGIDAVLAFAVFGRAPQVLFSDDAVLALCPRAGAATQRVTDLRKLIDSLPLYDVDTVWVDEGSAALRGVDAGSLPAFARLATAAQRRALLRGASAVLSY